MAINQPENQTEEIDELESFSSPTCDRRTALKMIAFFGVALSTACEVVEISSIDSSQRIATKMPEKISSDPNLLNPKTKPVLSEMELEKITKDLLYQLDTYRKMTFEEFFYSHLTKELIRKHIDEGTLFILLLAVDSKNPNNVIEKADRSLSFYEDMIKNFLEEGNEFRKKINDSYGLGQRDLLKKLKSDPYRGYFSNKPLLKVSFDFEALSQEELLALYQFCLLEEQVRESGIIYNSGAEFYATLFPKGGFNFERQSDCNGIAGYYCSLISFSGSRLLEKSVKFASLEEHAELIFVNGALSFVKNTSNVEEDESGSNNLLNFYDPEFDFQLYGASNKSLGGLDNTVYSEITEIVTSGEEVICKVGAEEAKKKLKLLEKSFELSQGSPTAMSNYIDFVFRLKELKEIESDEASRMIEKVLAKYIDLTYFAAFDVSNFVKTFGCKRGKAILDLYEESILRSQDRFIDFVLAPIKAKKALPKFDFSLGVENRMRLLNLLYAISRSFSACFLYKKLYGALEKEKKTWKK